MNKEELYNAITHIDEELLDLSKNESCDSTSRKDMVNIMSKKINFKKMWLPIAASLVVAFVAVGFFTFGQNKAPVQTPGSESGYVSSATISTEKITQSDTTKPIQQTTITTSAAHSSTEESTKIDTTKPVQNTTVTNPAVHTSKEENTKSNTTQPVPNTTNPMIPEEQASSLEEWRIKEVKYAMTALPKVDAEKINIDKSYNDAMISDSPIDGYRWNAQNLPGWEFGAGEEAYVMHLDAKDFYYEVVISAGFNKIYAVKKFNK